MATLIDPSYVPFDLCSQNMKNMILAEYSWDYLLQRLLCTTSCWINYKGLLLALHIVVKNIKDQIWVFMNT